MGYAADKAHGQVGALIATDVVGKKTAKLGDNHVGHALLTDVAMYKGSDGGQVAVGLRLLVYLLDELGIRGVIGFVKGIAQLCGEDPLEYSVQEMLAQVGPAALVA